MSTPNKILITTPFYFPIAHGGAANVYKNLIKFSNNKFVFYTNLWSGDEKACEQYDSQVSYEIIRARDMVFYIEHNSSKLIAILKLIRYLFFHTFSFLRALRKTKPDILFCGEVYNLGWLVYIANKLTKKKVLCHVHGEEVTAVRSGLWARFLQWGMRGVFKISDKIIVVSTFTKDVLVQKGVVESKIIVINNGVNCEIFYPKQKNSLLIEKLGIKDKKVLLTLSRLMPKKGIDKVLECLPEIAKAIPEVFYLVIGTGPDRERLEKITVDLGLQARVLFAGFVEDDELNDFVNLGDVFILLNRDISGDTEGFGIVFLQASACGLPVIGGRDGGTGDAILEGKTGFRIDGNDKGQAVSMVRELFENELLRKKMGEFGEQWVRENLEWKVLAEKFDNVFSCVISEEKQKK